MVMRTDMTYVQTCIGFILGYFAIAFLLLPVYYRLNLTTIYSYLKDRLGKRSYKTGAWFFLTSKMTGAAVRFYVVCIILQRFVFDAVGVPFPITVVGMTLLIWLYTRRGGIKTLVWTDTFQTTCMFAALLLIIYNVTQQLGMSVGEAVQAVAADEHSRMFVWDDWVSTQNFWKQLLSGAFIAIVMTGLDQDMMQKNLTCKSLREAQKDVCTYGFAFVPANLLFMALGVLLMMLAQKDGTPLPAAGDELLPMFAATGALGTVVTVFFTIGIVAASFSSADSALTALTTIYCVDICERPEDERLRRRAHVGIAVVFVAFILLFRMLNSTSVIDAIYVLCSYTHLKAIAAARAVGTFVCYAPRMAESAPFWPDAASLRETARAFFPQADVLLLKNSDLFPLFGSHELRTALFSLFSGHVQLIFYSDSENIHLFTRSVLLSAAKNDLTEAELLHRLCRLNTWPDKLAGLRESTLRKLLF